MSDYPQMLEELISASYPSAEAAREAARHLDLQKRRTVSPDGRVMHVAWPSFVGMTPTQIAEAGESASEDEAVYAASRERSLRLVPKLDRESTRDGLTGLLNRRGLEQRLELVPAQGRERQATYALVDLDFFKAANDEGLNGHATGDEVLVQVAHYLTNNLRPTDHVARYGGEEFILVLPATSTEDAVQVIDRLRAGLPDTVGYQRRRSDGDHVHHRQTMSVGITPLTISEGVTAGLRGANDAADRALYAAKSAGRNQTYLALGSEPVPYMP